VGWGPPFSPRRGNQHGDRGWLGVWLLGGDVRRADRAWLIAERIGSWHVMGTAVGGMLVAAALAIAATLSTATNALLLFGLSTARCIRCWFDDG
jgi:hypothetical protein